MKCSKTLAIVLLTALLMLFFSCKKEIVYSSADFKLGEYHITPDTTGARFYCNYSYPVDFASAFIELSQNEDMSEAIQQEIELEEGRSYVMGKLEGLLANTVYYYRYVFNDGNTAIVTEIESFTTQKHTVPTVKTYSLCDITVSSAMGGGKVVNEGGLPVLCRGVCWSTSKNPTLADAHTENGSGAGDFDASITGLELATTYYVKAYAYTSSDTCYGKQRSFTTLSGNAVVRISSISNVLSDGALIKGELLDDGGFPITEYGLCWSTSANPTIADPKVQFGSGSQSFVWQLTGLASGTLYYVRAYAVNNNGVHYGNEWRFNTFGGGELGGLFSISETEKVVFSKGNLQYQASTNTWRFAEHQWDYVGGDNANISSTYDGWIDLFGWATSGYDHGSIYYQPWSRANAEIGYFAYGTPGCNLYDQTGQADWGYNPISNGGNCERQWRTLSNDELRYVFYNRNDASLKRGCGVVHGEKGFILLPDVWEEPEGIPFGMTMFEYSDEEWHQMESRGAVFLPQAGTREFVDVYGVGVCCYYWTSTAYSSHYCANCLEISSVFANYSFGFTFSYLYKGYSVRLCKNVCERSM